MNRKHYLVVSVVCLIWILFLIYAVPKLSGQIVTEVDSSYIVKWRMEDTDSLRYDPDVKFRIYEKTDQHDWISNQQSDTFRIYYPPAPGDYWYYITATYPDRGARESSPSDIVIARVTGSAEPPLPPEFTPLPHTARAWNDILRKNNGWQGFPSLDPSGSGNVGIAKGDSVWKVFSIEGGTYEVQTRLDGSMRVKFGEVDTIFTTSGISENKYFTVELEPGIYYLKYIGVANFSSFEYGDYGFDRLQSIVVDRIGQPRQALPPAMIWVEEEP